MARAFWLGLTFKENCPDLRNTRVVDVIAELNDYGIEVDVFDPWADPTDAEQEYDITPISQPSINSYDGIVLAVAHLKFIEMGAAAIRQLGRPDHVLYDLKYVFPSCDSDLRL